jgi:hypothetical protein
MAHAFSSGDPSALYTADEAVDEISRPNIEWIPLMKTFKDRVETLQQLYPNRRTTVPPGWPAEVDMARAWDGSDFGSEDDYVLHLGPEDVVEIEAALAHFKSLDGLGPDDVDPSTFPLPNLYYRLIEASEIIHNGRGFVVLRGLDPDKYTSFDNILLYLGVTSYIAEKRGMQDFDGRMIRASEYFYYLSNVH